MKKCMKRCMLVALLLGGAAAAYGEIYTWKDARGTAHYTNSLNEIPARYLRKARVLDVATGKKGGLATAQPATAAAAPAGGQQPVQSAGLNGQVAAPPSQPSAAPPPATLPPTPMQALPAVRSSVPLSREGIGQQRRSRRHGGGSPGEEGQ